MDQDNGSEDVGYARPPKQHQFQKGKSGNPKGRPKGCKNLDTYLEQEANQKISITENGKQIIIPKKHAIVKVAVNKSLTGNDRSIANIMPQLARIDEKQEQARAAGKGKKITEEDHAILQRFGWVEEKHASEPEPIA